MNDKPPVPTRVIHVGAGDPDSLAALNATLAGLFDRQDPLPRLAQLLAEARAILPDRLKNDRYWLPCALIFYSVPALREAIPGFFDFRRNEIDVDDYNAMILDSLSASQQVLVRLAFHLYNDRHPLPSGSLISLRLLDPFHFELAILAIRLAHGATPFAPWETPEEEGATP